MIVALSSLVHPAQHDQKLGLLRFFALEDSLVTHAIHEARWYYRKVLCRASACGVSDQGTCAHVLRLVATESAALQTTRLPASHIVIMLRIGHGLVHLMLMSFSLPGVHVEQYDDESLQHLPRIPAAGVAACIGYIVNSYENVDTKGYRLSCDIPPLAPVADDWMALGTNHRIRQLHNS